MFSSPNASVYIYTHLSSLYKAVSTACQVMSSVHPLKLVQTRRKEQAEASSIPVTSNEQ